jgi:hypothetical protein
MRVNLCLQEYVQRVARTPGSLLAMQVGPILVPLPLGS